MGARLASRLSAAKGEKMKRRCHVDYPDFEDLYRRMAGYRPFSLRDRVTLRPSEPERYTEVNPPQGNGHQLGSRGNFPKRRGKQPKG